jgi:hypothetical protein
MSPVRLFSDCQQHSDKPKIILPEATWSRWPASSGLLASPAQPWGRMSMSSQADNPNGKRPEKNSAQGFHKVMSIISVTIAIVIIIKSIITF